MAFNQAHAIVIGVGSHQFAPHLDVPQMAADASALAEVLGDSQACGYPASQVSLLNGDKASRDGILSALAALAGQVSAEDTVFFFYSGHSSLGTDGSFYLVSHDAQIDTETGRVVKNTGVSETELVQHLRAIPARHVLMVFNTGIKSPTLALGDQNFPFGTLSPDLIDAFLGTGEGRMIITACREGQVSCMGDGTITIFTQALVDGLKGKGVRNSGGTIGAYSLYEHVFETVSAVVQEKYDLAQEPELAVLHGLRPFAVALFRGASDYDTFDIEQPAPALPAVRQVKPEKAQKALSYYINVGDIKAESGGEVNIAGGDITHTEINTGGGAYVGGSVKVNGGDFVGRDKVVRKRK